jgi:hypothetical protein
VRDRKAQSLWFTVLKKENYFMKIKEDVPVLSKMLFNLASIFSGNILHRASVLVEIHISSLTYDPHSHNI